jgi:hypothetical protein
LCSWMGLNGLFCALVISSNKLTLVLSSFGMSFHFSNGDRTHKHRCYFSNS